MQALQAAAHSKGVVWIAVNSGGPGKEGHMTDTDAREYVSYKKLIVDHYINDPQGIIGKRYGAKATPHMFVIDKQGNVAYMGAIDDQPSPNPDTVKGAKNYVLAAVNSLAEGKPVETPFTQSYGCAVKYAE